MADGIEVNMTPAHPGDFVRTEVIEELGLSVTRGSRDSGSSPGDAFGSSERQRFRYRRRWPFVSRRLLP